VVPFDEMMMIIYTLPCPAWRKYVHSEAPYVLSLFRSVQTRLGTRPGRRMGEEGKRNQRESLQLNSTERHKAGKSQNLAFSCGQPKTFSSLSWRLPSSSFHFLPLLPPAFYKTRRFLVLTKENQEGAGDDKDNNWRVEETLRGFRIKVKTKVSLSGSTTILAIILTSYRAELVLSTLSASSFPFVQVQPIVLSSPVSSTREVCFGEPAWWWWWCG